MSKEFTQDEANTIGEMSEKLRVGFVALINKLGLENSDGFLGEDFYETRVAGAYISFLSFITELYSTKERRYITTITL